MHCRFSQNCGIWARETQALVVICFSFMGKQVYATLFGIILVDVLRMVKFSINNARYIYLHDQKYTSTAVDIHHIVARKSRLNGFIVYILALVTFATAFYLYHLKEISVNIVYCSLVALVFDIFLIKLLLQKPVKKESVVIFPAFGVQLETHFMSGKTICQFVPIDKILKPVLLECVTPVTCYWTLSLIIRGESELMLVFKLDLNSEPATPSKNANPCLEGALHSNQL